MATALAGLLAVYAVGCSFVVPPNQSITINSNPSGAEVHLNGNFVGVTPGQYSVPRNQEQNVMITKDGYNPAMRTTTRQLSTTGILDIIGGILFLLPFLGLLSAGAWEQTPDNITVTLVEQ
jgi:hypothetical protein